MGGIVSQSNFEDGRELSRKQSSANSRKKNNELAQSSIRMGNIGPTSHEVASAATTPILASTQLNQVYGGLQESGISNTGAAMVNESRKAPVESAKERHAHNRIQLFERVELRKEGSLVEMLQQDNGLDDSPETKKLLLLSMSNFLFLEQDIQNDSKMLTLLKAFVREEFSAGETIITEGESGSKLYILEHGTVEIFINGEFIREMGRGNIFGELALLYDAPRSATVRGKADNTSLVLWSLSRSIFKHIQVESSSSAQAQRARWLINSPDLAILGAIDLSRLVATLHHQRYSQGTNLYTRGKPSLECMVVERGFVSIFATVDMEKLTPHEIDRALSIVRPRGDPQYVNKKIVCTNDSLAHVCDATPGCILGIDILKSKAGVPNSWEWVGGGAIIPFTALASEEAHCLVFTPDVFERLFGSLRQVFKMERSLSIVPSRVDEDEITFDVTKFKVKYVLGSGSFGTVTLAEYRDGTPDPPCYALKSLSKANIVETGQVRHIIDERMLLSMMRSRFILKLHGAYQTPHQLIMVTEVLECGDLWSVLYERNENPEKGLTPDLVAFYTAILVLGLSHIHEKGVAFRDLKPENIMVDNKGYLRIIDFGFGKKIPYSTTEPNGVIRVHPKSFTLCGTPEYLAPEFVFNLGHDSSCDIWALGVLVYEMFMIVTPFAPAKPDNVTELFTNIATVKKSGLNLPLDLEVCSHPLPARSIITALLQPEPSERLGVQEGSTSCILEHPFFNYVSIDDINSGKVVPSYIPVPLTYHEPLTSLAQVKPYRGDQSIFADF